VTRSQTCGRVPALHAPCARGPTRTTRHEGQAAQPLAPTRCQPRGVQCQQKQEEGQARWATSTSRHQPRLLGQPRRRRLQQGQVVVAVGARQHLYPHPRAQMQGEGRFKQSLSHLHLDLLQHLLHSRSLRSMAQQQQRQQQLPRHHLVKHLSVEGGSCRLYLAHHHHLLGEGRGGHCYLTSALARLCHVAP
jgi:hypothetical protein